MATPFRGAFACPANERTSGKSHMDLSEGRNAGECVNLTVFDGRQDARDGGQVVQAADGLRVQR